jgi:hypothetical protein
MLELAGSIKSNVRDELESKERGVRHWSMVAIEGDAWFQVESCFHTEGVPTVTTYILPDLENALSLVRYLKGNSWTALRLYSRLPLIAKTGFILEPIKQIFSTQDGTQIFLLSSGLTVYRTINNQKMPVSFAGVKEVYSSR